MHCAVKPSQSPCVAAAIVHCVFMILGGLLVIAGESRLPVLLDYFQFVATFKVSGACAPLPPQPAHARQSRTVAVHRELFHSPRSR